MATALVGSSGFVGGNLRAARTYTNLYNSTNSQEMAGQHFEMVVFAAAKAEKWRINQDPDADERHMAELREILGSFTTDRLILISTVDVYKKPIDVDESTPVETGGLHPYGLHRYQLEEFAKAQHPHHTTVVRLPGLFGAGLKKNVIFDLLNDHNVEKIHPGGRFQYYNLARLAHDIDAAVSAGLELVNLCSGPIATEELARECFGMELTLDPSAGTPGLYDMRTMHAAAFGGAGDYTYDRQTVVTELRDFVRSAENRK